MLLSITSRHSSSPVQEPVKHRRGDARNTARFPRTSSAMRQAVLTSVTCTFAGKRRRSDNHRLQLVALASLLREFQDLDAIGRCIRQALASKVVGGGPVGAAVERVREELSFWGYGRSIGRCEVPNVVRAALPRNRSPLLEDLSRAFWPKSARSAPRTRRQANSVRHWRVLHLA